MMADVEDCLPIMIGHGNNLTQPNLQPTDEALSYSTHS